MEKKVYPEKEILQEQTEQHEGNGEPTFENVDVDHFFRQSAEDTEIGEEELPDDEAFDDLLHEIMNMDEDLISQIEEMEDESRFSLNRIVVPEELALDQDYCGPVYGFYRQDTGYHVIYGWDGHAVPDEIGATCIGIVADVKESELILEGIPGISLGTGACIVGRRNKEGLSFYDAKYDSVKKLFITGRELETEVYTMTKKLFSRNSGLIETDWMNDACAIISGCGSVGSLVALQLARSGVGRFVLIDEDCVEIHNVCRHQCGLKDIGRRKVDAVRERILCINPNAEVICFRKKFQDVPWPYGREEWLLPEKAIFIGTCDNRVGNAYVCDAAYENGVPFAALGFNARAWGGEIFTCLPEKKDICYRCAFKKLIEESIQEERRNHDYIDASDAGKVTFEPGLDVDIEYGVSLFDKVLLDILNRHNPKYAPRIYHTLKQYLFFSGTDQIPDKFWKAQMKDPISMKRVGLRDSLRRCEHCVR